MSSSHQVEQARDTKQFTITVFIAFVVVFAFVMLVSSLWQGSFKPVVPTFDATTATEK